MPYRYRRFYYSGPVDIEDWILDVWIPKHRSLQTDKAWIESQIKFGDWGRVTNNRFCMKPRVFEGSKLVEATRRAEIMRDRRGILKVTVYYAHARRLST